MDKEACIEFLKKKCPQEEDNFFTKISQTLWSCISCHVHRRLPQDFEDSNELLQHLEKQPMKTLECPKSGQYVAEGMRGEVLMVEYYLELGHQLTMESYSK